jgi:polysaccharide deacetylase 2 family uncharacterized protein YibQ
VTDQGGALLHKPLGQKAGARRLAVPAWFGKAAFGAVSLVFIGLGAGMMLLSDPMSGEPTATAQIKAREPVPALAAQPRSGPIDPTTGRAVATAAEMENASGVTVVRPGADAPNSVIIRVGDPNAITLAPAPDPRIVERSRHGVLPRIGANGERAFDIYARPVGALPANATARIGIVIGGLGISQNTTAEAIAKLPGQISLAFAPYGSELERSVARARSDGHEVFLQVPMEPFDYPDSDPGPHTLLTSLKPAENLERLHWAMARFSGYAGVVNFTGGRFTADESAIQPILRELSQRGLMVLDDGSSPRSLLTSGAGPRAPALKADLVLDGTVRADAIDRQLARLEELARERGMASASASALPLTVERIARWSRGLEQKGIALVPMTSLAARSPATTGSIR